MTTASGHVLDLPSALAAYLARWQAIDPATRRRLVAEQLTLHANR